MSILAILILVVLLWAVNSFVPPPWKTLFNILLVLCLILWLLWVFNLTGYFGGCDLPHGHHIRR